MRDEALARDASNPNDEGKPVWLVSLEWIDALNLEIMRAYREKRNVRFECPPGVANCFAEALLHYTDLKMPLLRAMVSIEDNIIGAAAVAEQTMKDEALRFSCAVADLELLLENFIGRPSMTMAEVREAAERPYPMRERAARGGMQVSSELARTVRTGRIGDPREPGQEG